MKKHFKEYWGAWLFCAVIVAGGITGGILSDINQSDRARDTADVRNQQVQVCLKAQGKIIILPGGDIQCELKP